MMLEGSAAVVVGGSRGLGRGAVEALANRGARVVVVGRDASSLTALANRVKGVETVVGDAADERVAQRMVKASPDLVVLCAGAHPPLGTLHDLSWEQFQSNWHIDTKLAFVWAQAALRRPMKRGSHVVFVSSGAARQGSPASGGYAAAKRAQWFIASYAATEIARANLGITVHCVLPTLSPATELGKAAVAKYARRANLPDAEIAKRFSPYLTPEIFGGAIVDLAAFPLERKDLAYQISGNGLAPIA